MYQYKHHEESANNYIEYYKDRPGVLAVVLGGSVAKGLARPDSDIDGVVVLTAEAYAQREASGEVYELVRGHCTYEAGYFDVKFVDIGFLEKAALRGSDPTRSAFVGARVMHCVDDRVPPLIAAIGRYPEEEAARRMDIFFAGLALSSGFFWRSAREAQDAYLSMRSTADTVYFGMRMLYAHNRVFFPCHKAMMEYARRLKNIPEGIVDMADGLLRSPSDEGKSAFIKAILECTGYKRPENYNDVLSTYVKYAEQWWIEGLPNIYEM